MSSMKGRIVRLLAGAVLQRATVVSTQEIGGFRRLLLSGEIPKFAAGAKVQLLLPTDDMRTYTPIPDLEGMRLLGWREAGGPGTRWLSHVRQGDELRFLGPQRSLELERGPTVIVGDETSVALAAAFAIERPGRVHAVIQSDAAGDVRSAVDSSAFAQLDVVPRGDTCSTVEAIADSLYDSPHASMALTGASGLVASVRDALRRAGVQNMKTKTYWIPGRSGLD